MASKKISFSNSENQNSKGPETVFGYQPKKKENKTTFEMVPIESISLDPKGEFQQLYPLEEENICNISESMKKKRIPESSAVGFNLYRRRKFNIFRRWS